MRAAFLSLACHGPRATGLSCLPRALGLVLIRAVYCIHISLQLHNEVHNKKSIQDMVQQARLLPPPRSQRTLTGPCATARKLMGRRQRNSVRTKQEQPVRSVIRRPHKRPADEWPLRSSRGRNQLIVVLPLAAVGPLWFPDLGNLVLSSKHMGWAGISIGEADLADPMVSPAVICQHGLARSAVHASALHTPVRPLLPMQSRILFHWPKCVERARERRREQGQAERVAHGCSR